MFVTRAMASATDPGQWFIGDASFCTPQFDPVPGNYIGGNLAFNDIASGGIISNNDIEGKLHCGGNTPAPTGGNNAADKGASGQCATFGGGLDDAMSPPLK